jgi:hypothetical protein
MYQASILQINIKHIQLKFVRMINETVELFHFIKASLIIIDGTEACHLY